jgi:hypothetical protein
MLGNTNIVRVSAAASGHLPACLTITLATALAGDYVE